ncbi:MAG: PEP-utilizing enzyme [archaeon]
MDRKDKGKSDRPEFSILRDRKADYKPVLWNLISQTSNQTKRFHGKAIGTYFYYFSYPKATYFFYKDDWDAVQSHIFGRIMREKSYVSKMNALQHRQGMRLLKFQRRVMALDLSKRPMKQLFSLYQQTKKLWLLFDAMNVFPWYAGGDLLSKELHTRLAKRYGLSEDEIALLLTPPKPSFTMMEEKEFLELVLLLKKKHLEKLFDKSVAEIKAKLPKSIHLRIKALSKRYIWIPFGYDAEALFDEEHYINYAKEHIQAESDVISQKIARIAGYEKDISSRQKALIQEHAISDDILRLVKDFQQLVVMTDERKEIHYPLNMAFDRIIVEIAARLGITRLEAKFLRMEELKKHANDREKLSQLANERIHNPFITMKTNKSGKIHELRGKEAEKYLHHVIRGCDGASSVKGIAASKSEKPVRGTAKIMISPAEMAKMSKGDVLIAPMTTPQFVPAMRKASAIITDEGGLTCHAAIVSRELGIPCLIATGNASKTFKDGDIVEVDTVQGIARLIDRPTGNRHNGIGDGAAQKPMARSFFSDKIILTDDLSLFEFPPGSDFRHLVARQTALLLEIAFPLGVGDKERSKRYFGYEHAHDSIYAGEKVILYDFAKIAEERKKIIALHEKDKRFFLGVAMRCEKEGDELMRYSLGIRKKDHSKLTDAELSSLFEECMKRIIEFDIYIMIPHSIQGYLAEELEKELKKHDLDPETFARHRAALTTPTKPNEGFFEQESILELAVEHKRKGLTPELKKKIKDHSLEYGHIGCKYGVGPIWDYDDILERVKFLSSSGPEKRLAELLKFNRSIQANADKSLSELKASKKLRELVQLIRAFVFVRTFRTDVLSGTFANLMPLIFEIGRRNNLSSDEIMRCLPHEIAEQKFPSKEKLKERANFALRTYNGAVHYVEGEQAKRVIDRYSQQKELKKEDAADEVKGTVANNGKVIGKVKVVLHNSELGKVKPGDILIAAMTTPDYVPAMEKAAAFVTDEGGILCHAAIVSREMGKPCIIGTGKATRTFKDGDVVEVDADKGVVRKLSGGSKSK